MSKLQGVLFHRIGDRFYPTVPYCHPESPLYQWSDNEKRFVIVAEGGAHHAYVNHSPETIKKNPA